MSIKQPCLKKKLRRIIAASPGSLRSAVAEEALDCDYEIETFFSDLLDHGCQSGIIGSLVYYRDTHAFYDAHYDEIEELRTELEEALGKSLRPQGDLKNWYAWLAFEETAHVIVEELGL